MDINLLIGVKIVKPKLNIMSNFLPIQYSNLKYCYNLHIMLPWHILQRTKCSTKNNCIQDGSDDVNDDVTIMDSPWQ